MKLYKIQFAAMATLNKHVGNLSPSYTSKTRDFISRLKEMKEEIDKYIAFAEEFSRSVEKKKQNHIENQRIKVSYKKKYNSRTK